MGQALYRKYRSKSLAELVGQEHITTTLRNALDKGMISHAYLFTGPRGVGKTSTARILAYEVNGLPYDEQATHLDIIEIDAASNRRIDEIRALRERVHNAPSSAKYKVYIIDEVHMLTKEAFNALLKTLEEPPAHAIFILATTEAHKLPETIISRTQRFTFKPAERSAAIKHLRHIADQEGIDIHDEALELIAQHGGGSFRDSISLLDQVSNTGAVIDLAAAQRMLGIAPDTAIAELLQLLSTGGANTLLDRLQNLHEQGYQAAQIAKQLARQLRTDLLAGKAPLDPIVITKLMQQLIDVPAAHDPQALLEIVLLEVILTNGRGPTTTSTLPAPKPSPPPKQPDPSPKPPAETSVSDQPAEPAPPKPPTKSLATPKVPLDETTWQTILQTLKQKHNTLYGIARMASPLFGSDELTLVFDFPFHQKRFSDARNKQILADIITEHTGGSFTITCIVDKKANHPAAARTTPKAEPKDNLATISNIFGSAEVLE